MGNDSSNNKNRIETINYNSKNSNNSNDNKNNNINCSLVLQAEEMKKKIDLKFSANICINGLTTLWEVPNGHIEVSIIGRYWISQLCFELAALFKLERDRDRKEIDRIDRRDTIDKVLDEEIIERYVINVCKQTAKNQSSMLQDYKEGRKTEIEYLHGYIMKRYREIEIDRDRVDRTDRTDRINRIDRITIPYLTLLYESLERKLKPFS